ncbi:NAD(P)/FAD-dependent oxidoreductase [Vulgatibacter incomptus]|uniref:Putative oxidoreductase n=1 Tax=Vulgatibacter incomptus TaxID=1391653 RepID=A0A0K1PHH3_9BACT|nr:NAD(P)/FAD-dependent oxidoreductase [Vulgatibacter incomptus]AKU92970.1 putative oxidoreductase [Vulgatibacter incomptus]
MLHELAIVGAGPAGLALAIQAASRGIATVVFDARASPLDKACGEGLMPGGVRALEALGVALPSRDACVPFNGIRYVQEDGSEVSARFRRGVGLGIRRVALQQALLARANALGVELRLGCGVSGFSRMPGALSLHTEAGVVRARMVVAADGLASPLRRQAGLEGCPPAIRRFGARRHYRLAPWSDHVEVHWAEGVEAYVTPAGERRVGVALLWDAAHLGPRRHGELLARFPLLAERLAGAPVDSDVRGAGPMARSVKRRIGERLALLGDAAGYVDAISGEGLSSAFQASSKLASLLPDALARHASPRALMPYEKAAAAAFRRHEAVTRAMLLLSRHPAARRHAFAVLARRPSLFEALVAAVENLGFPDENRAP